jgi:hypothetical protein
VRFEEVFVAELLVAKLAVGLWIENLRSTELRAAAAAGAVRLHGRLARKWKRKRREAEWKHALIQ